MNWSQENCLIDDHRLTRERRGGDPSFKRQADRLAAFSAGGAVVGSCAHAAA